ncbi:MAG: molybdopterin converting factor subunit 1 [Sneathiella sp.]|nr:molybdopterin converting factor subunit 1 [Sneathiella sp.]
MKILYFAWLRSAIGMPEETINLPEGVRSLHQLIEWQKGRGPAFEKAFADMDTIRIAVNQEYITDDITLTGNEEIAFFPPVTGG